MPDAGRPAEDRALPVRRRELVERSRARIASGHEAVRASRAAAERTQRLLERGPRG